MGDSLLLVVSVKKCPVPVCKSKREKDSKAVGIEKEIKDQSLV